MDTNCFASKACRNAMQKAVALQACVPIRASSHHRAKDSLRKARPENRVIRLDLGDRRTPAICQKPEQRLPLFYAAGVGFGAFLIVSHSRRIHLTSGNT